jgi:hypothetical protein
VRDGHQLGAVVERARERALNHQRDCEMLLQFGDDFAPQRAEVGIGCAVRLRLECPDVAQVACNHHTAVTQLEVMVAGCLQQRFERLPAAGIELVRQPGHALRLREGNQLFIDTDLLREGVRGEEPHFMDRRRLERDLSGSDREQPTRIRALDELLLGGRKSPGRRDVSGVHCDARQGRVRRGFRGRHGGRHERNGRDNAEDQAKLRDP